MRPANQKNTISEGAISEERIWNDFLSTFSFVSKRIPYAFWLFGNTKYLSHPHHSMKHIIAIVILAFLPSINAQSDQQQPVQIQRRRITTEGGETVPLKANYLVTLSSKEGDKPVYNLSFIVATNRFNASTGDTFVTFSGELNEDKENSLLAVYTLAIKTVVETASLTTISDQPSAQATAKSISYVSSGAGSSAIITLDKPLRIFSSGNREYTLTISKVESKK